MPITLREGLVLALENNPDIVIEKLTPRIREARIDRERGVFDVEAFASAKREESKTPLSARASAASSGLMATESESYSLNAGVEGRMPLGTRYTLEVKEESAADTFNRFSEQYASFAGLRLVQPVLKNFGRDANETLIKIAAKDREISRHALKERICSIAAEYAAVYWDLSLRREELKVKENALSLAETLLELNRKKLAAGASSQLDVTQAASAAAARKDAVLVARMSVKEKEKELKLLIAPDMMAVKDTEVVPTQKAEVVHADFDLENVLGQAIARRPDYLEAKTEIEKNNIKIRYAENQTYPAVDIETTYGYNGLGSSIGDSVRGMDANPQWSVGLMFRYPLENTAATGDLRAAKLEAGQLLLKLKKLERKIVLEVDSAIKNVRDLKDRVETAKTAAFLSEKTLKAEEEKLRAGRSTTYDVLRTQDDLTRARLGEISAVIDYNKALIKYNRETGTILEALGVDIAAGR